MLRSHRRLLCASAASLLVLGIAACGGTTKDNSSDSGTAAQAGASADPNAKLKEGLKIAYLPKQLNNPYSDVEVSGGKEAVGELKGEYKLVGPNDASASSQVSYINTLIQQQQDVIVIAANDPNAVCPSLNQARQARHQRRRVRLRRRQGVPRRLHQPGHHPGHRREPGQDGQRDGRRGGRDRDPLRDPPTPPTRTPGSRS
nr:hypothetical protein GCM10020092_102300 [Actinoplanes digitatis]